MIRFGPDVCQNLDSAVSKEWIETNGLGGFASSTITGLNTRRYHGLLVAATKPPLGRLVLLSKLEETLVVGEERFELSVNRYPGTFYPDGFRHLKEFRLDPFPVLTYEAGGVELEKRVFMVQGENTTVVEYELRDQRESRGAACRLEIRPLIAFRDYHSTTHSNGALNPVVDQQPGLARVKPYTDLPALHFAHDAESIEGQGSWYYRFEYGIEQERGLDFEEDLFNPFVARFDLSHRSLATVIASTEPRNAADAPILRNAEIERRDKILETAPSPEPLVRSLVAAADQFIVERGELKTIIAGYPWFGDWGRDTMIALPGLALTLGRTEIARSVLLAFAQHVDQGMLPNRFPDAGEAPEYNTVDATLWFFEVVREFLERTEDDAFVEKQLYPVLKDIVDWHVRGTRYGIRVEDDGLLTAGEAGAQLTWMDAKIGDWVVTPRHGKPVEIEALWYNALCIMRGLAERFGDTSAGRGYGEMAAKASSSFEPLFWNETNRCLYDVVSGEFRDSSIRPNQIFAVSLPHTMISAARARGIVEVVEEELLTPYGLRSLSAKDPQYRPRYEGDPLSRDSAYHQGTVWPWLLGPFLTAYLRVHGGSRKAREQAAEWLAGCAGHLSEAGLGQISEIFDAEPPHRPRGCFAQAWSVAELLRVAVEEVFQQRPAARVRREVNGRRPVTKAAVG